MLGNRHLRLLLGLSWLAGIWVLPEGLAVPSAAAVGAGPAGVGWLLAANPAGNVIGALVMARWVPPHLRATLLGPLAVAAGLPLILCAFRPGLLLTVPLWALAGLCSAYQVQLIAEYIAAVPDAMRGQAIGLASAGLLAVQGLGLLIGGALAQIWTVHTTIAVAGAAGVFLASWLAVSRARAHHTAHT